MVLQKANALLTREPRAARRFARRVRLLQEIQQGRWIVLYSDKLLAEYLRQVPSPRNDFVKTFLAIISNRAMGMTQKNWPRWPGGLQERMRNCRYPSHDKHVLRTAYTEGTRSTLVSEEQAILSSRNCILRVFDVAIRDI